MLISAVQWFNYIYTYIYMYIYIYTHTHSFLYSFPIWFIIGYWIYFCVLCRLPQWLSSEEFICNAGDMGEVGLIPGLGRSLGEGNVHPLQYSCWENTMDRWAWWAIAHGVTKSWTWLKRQHACRQFYTVRACCLSILYIIAYIPLTLLVGM